MDSYTRHNTDPELLDFLDQVDFELERDLEDELLGDELPCPDHTPRAATPMKQGRNR